MKEQNELPSKVEEKGREWLFCGLKDSEERLEEYLEMNDALDPESLGKSELPDEEDPKVRKINKRAAVDGYLSGKWEFSVPPKNVDSIWSEIKKLISQGKIWGGQVSTEWIRKKQKRDEHTIRVYTPNYLDEEDVLRVGELLKKRCNLKEEICYKPDIYNVLQIYSDEGEKRKLPKEIRYKV